MAQPAGHAWVVAATVEVTEGVAKQAHRRGTCRIAGATKVEAMDIYCRKCRRPIEDVIDKPCSADGNRDHLIGGPTGERKKRNRDPEEGDDDDT